MNPQKRGRYKVYLADKSVPVPKVSAWRFRKGDIASEECSEIQPMSYRPVSDDDPANYVDSFHREAFEDQVSL